LNAYCTAVDKLSDIDGLLSIFTEDAVFDLRDIHLPYAKGHAEITCLFRTGLRDDDEPYAH